MIDGQPSRTAARVAHHRAAHQRLDDPRVLEDPIASRIVDPAAAATDDDLPGARRLRAFVAVRSRFAEDELAVAVARGVDQYVVLGAGLDTFAYRNPFGARLRVFEVDFPATQMWKRARLAAAAIAIPPSLTFAPVDFEHQTLADGLRTAGFDSMRPAWFSWLGVTMYLSEAAVTATLAFVASTPAGGGVVADYALARAALDAAGQRTLDALSARVAAAGEAIVTTFEPAALATSLRALGFGAIEDLDAGELEARYFRGRADGLSLTGTIGRIFSATI